MTSYRVLAHARASRDRRRFRKCTCARPAREVEVPLLGAFSFYEERKAARPLSSGRATRERASSMNVRFTRGFTFVAPFAFPRPAAREFPGRPSSPLFRASPSRSGVTRVLHTRSLTTDHTCPPVAVKWPRMGCDRRSAASVLTSGC